MKALKQVKLRLREWARQPSTQATETLAMESDAAPGLFDPAAARSTLFSALIDAGRRHGAGTAPAPRFWKTPNASR